MSDIVEALRLVDTPLCRAALDEIERLREAMRWIADHSNDPGVVGRARKELLE